MKICHITSCHKQKDTRIFYKECVSLAKKKDFEVFLVTPGNENEICEGVHLISVGEKPMGRLSRIINFSAYVVDRAIETNADIYHLHDPELLLHVKKLKKNGAKIIFDSHENMVDNIVSKPYLIKPIAYILSKLYKMYIKTIKKNLDGVIGVTPNHYEDLKIYADEIAIITNYPVLYSEKNIRKETADVVTICFTGGISNSWSIEKVINAINNCDMNVQLLLCGPVEAQYYNEVIQCSLSDKVKYLGNLPYDEAIEIQRKSDIGIAMAKYSPALGYNIGTIGNTKIFEYMMAGLPIICTDFILWREIINKTECGICVSPENTDGILKAIECISSNKELRNRYSANARRAAEQTYNWKKQEEKLYRFYNKIISE